MTNSSLTRYSENYEGIISHDGWIRVAKSKITAKVSNIQGNTIRVKSFNKRKSRIVQYNCTLHKHLQKDKRYLSVNDTVSIKWNCSTPYIVGFRKANNEPKPLETCLDDFNVVTENTTWLDSLEDGLSC